jgi:hypothetical protein
VRQHAEADTSTRFYTSTIRSAGAAGAAGRDGKWQFPQFAAVLTAFVQEHAELGPGPRAKGAF